ncbi:MAG: glycosyltransferase family 2 protein [Eubacterium sp.]|nr:glycosyltransferase family 2 protein [Eubacterium sp.]
MIDILLATYNGEKFIDKQIKSLVTQSRDSLNQDLRLVIRDDGSTDNTISIIKKRLEYYKKKRENPIDVLILDDKKPSGSPSGNFTRMLSLSQADYIMFSDQDDMWYRRKTEETYACMKRLEEKYGKTMPLMVHTDLSLMDESGKKIATSFYDYQKLPREDSLAQLMIQNTVTGCTVMMNRAAVDLLKEAPASEMLLMYDHFAAILVAATGKIAFIDEPLIRYRQHEGNIVGAHAADSVEEYKSRFSFGRAKFLKDMDKSYRQVGYIVKRYEDRIRQANGQETVDLMKEYSKLLMASKVERMNFFQKHKVYKSGKLKKLVQLIWC